LRSNLNTLFDGTPASWRDSNEISISLDHGYIRNGVDKQMQAHNIRISNRLVVGWLLDRPPSTTSAVPLT
jgi:hypothetical protein